MKDYSRVIKYSEFILVIFVWLVLIITPVLFRDDYNNPISRSIYNQIEILVPLSILFAVNRFILVPRLLFKGRWQMFISMVSGLIIFLTICSFVYDTRIRNDVPPLSESKNPVYDIQRFPPPVGRAEGRPGDRRPPGQRQPRPMPPFANFLILSVLIVGFDTGLRSGLRWIKSENEKMSLEKENVANQLSMLRNQISPHFFMNTLNNIHSLIDLNSEEAKEAIIKLSRMMRYLIYETDSDKAPLKKEIVFIESYVDLMRLRLNANVNIALNIPEELPDVQVPPLIFTSFVENAFKHGISYKDKSFISIDLAFGEKRLLLVIKNSKASEKSKDDSSGIGIENTRKRLELLYGNSYHLDIIDGRNQYTVNLSIPL